MFESKPVFNLKNWFN